MIVMKVEGPIYYCDGPGCTQMRGVTNHWLVVYATPKLAYACQPWEKADAQVTDARHLCGFACAMKFHSIWLSELLSGSRGAIGKTAPLEAAAEV